MDIWVQERKKICQVIIVSTPRNFGKKHPSILWKDWKYYFDQKDDHLWIFVGIYAYASFDLKYRQIAIFYGNFLQRDIKTKTA